MPRIAVTKVFTFEAAHSLPGHEGECSNLHGHSYRLEVTISGPLQVEGTAEGMILDFANISQVVKREVISQWDHRYLNEILPFRTTAENLVVEIYRRLLPYLPLVRVRLWETATAFAEMESDNVD